MRGPPRWSLWQHNSGDHLLLCQPPCQLPRHHWRMASKTITLNNQTEDMPPRHNTTPSFLTSSTAVDTHISRVHDLSPGSTTKTHTWPTVATTANSHHCYALPPYVNTSTSHHHAQKPSPVVRALRANNTDLSHEIDSEILAQYVSSTVSLNF